MIKDELQENTITIAEFIRVIRSLQSDEPRVQPGVWYTTQKQHWLGWLGEYDGPGAYGRIPGKQRDAKFAYNHIVCPEALLWLIEAAGVRQELVQAAQSATETGTSLMQKADAIRRHVPWSELYNVLWGSGRTVPKANFLERFLGRKSARAAIDRRAELDCVPAPGGTSEIALGV